MSLLLPVLTSAALPTEPTCVVEIDGETAVRVLNETTDDLLFKRRESLLAVRSHPQYPRALSLIMVDSETESSGYVVAAFKGDQLDVRTEINGQHLAVVCRRR